MPFSRTDWSCADIEYRKALVAEKRVRQAVVGLSRLGLRVDSLKHLGLERVVCLALKARLESAASDRDALVALYPSVHTPELASQHFGLDADCFRERRPRPAEVGPSVRHDADNDPGDVRQCIIDSWQRSYFLRRAMNARGRILSELHESASLRWPVCLVTLTVEPEHYDRFLEAGGPMWSEFQRRMRRLIRREVHGSARHRCGDCCSSIMCIPEPGEQRGRWHLHALVGARRFPSRVECDPKETRHNWRELEPLLKWPYGYDQWLPLRYDEADVWAVEKGHGWPVQRNRNGLLVAQRIGSVEQVATYVSKYLLKYVPKEDMPCRMRMRATRQYGIKQFERALAKSERLRRLLWRAPGQASWMLRLPRSYVASRLGKHLKREWLREDLLSVESQVPRMLNALEQCVRTTSRVGSVSTGACGTRDGSRLLEQSSAVLELLRNEWQGAVLQSIVEPGYRRLVESWN